MNPSPLRFEFAMATRVVFGAGTLKEIGALARPLGQIALVVTGSTPRRAERLLGLLSAAGLSTSVFAVAGEPTVDDIVRGVAQARSAGCDLVIGFGGGSAIDAAKAIAAMLANEGELLDYLEVIGRGRALEQPSRPCIAIPTTAGTGAEVTRNAVLASPEHRVKVSLRSPLMLPRLALVDPELALRLPPAITAATGLDALTQLIEAFVCCRANPLTDALCREGLVRAARSLDVAWAEGENLAAREDMALAALFSGFALANAGLGAVHGLAGPLGGRFDAPHGAVCAALLPHVMSANLAALSARSPMHPALARYEELAALVTAEPGATAEQGVEWVAGLVDELAIPGLRAHGVDESHFESLVIQAQAASSMKGNPLPLTPQELAQVLRQSL
jgi:alcohol dehydrogenase class IV